LIPLLNLNPSPAIASSFLSAIPGWQEESHQRQDRERMTDTPDKSDGAPVWAPKMAALRSDRQRAFICALYSEDALRKGNGLQLWAMERAGYQVTNKKSASVNAWKLLQDPKIRAAAAEYSRAVLRSLSPMTIQAVRELLANPKSKHHAKAIDAVLSRSDPLPKPETHVHIDQSTVAMNIDQMFARIRELAAKHGLDADMLLSGRMPPELLELRALKSVDEATTGAANSVTEGPRP
jgi:hypothetical protein